MERTAFQPRDWRAQFFFAKPNIAKIQPHLSIDFQKLRLLSLENIEVNYKHSLLREPFGSRLLQGYGTLCKGGMELEILGQPPPQPGDHCLPH